MVWSALKRNLEREGKPRNKVVQVIACIKDFWRQHLTPQYRYAETTSATSRKLFPWSSKREARPAGFELHFCRDLVDAQGTVLDNFDRGLHLHR